MRKSVPNTQIRAFAMAMAGATVAAVATMFVPVAVLEGMASSTGLSELIPAARAPLGDTARALLAFAAGAFTLAILAFFLLRPKSTVGQSVPASEWAEEDDATSFRKRLAMIKLPSIATPKMPWTKGEDDITELADLPKLRNGDSHPDAPPRRPLVASQDLPVLDQAEMAASASEVLEAPAATEAAAIPETAAESAVLPDPVAPTDVEPTLAEMVAQLEAAVAERQKQLAELEAVATELASTPPAIAAQTDQPEARIIARGENASQPVRFERPPLEAVPTVPVQDGDVDSALAAALETLHRMNATGR
jgi:hypothetical protein